jgi:hypothetical protein
VTDTTAPSRPTAVAYALHALANALHHAETVTVDAYPRPLVTVSLLAGEIGTRDAILSGLTDVTADTWASGPRRYTTWKGYLLAMPVCLIWPHPAETAEAAAACMAPEPFGPVPVGTLLQALTVETTAQPTPVDDEDQADEDEPCAFAWIRGSDGWHEHDHDECREAIADQVEEVAAAAADMPAGRVDTWPVTVWPPRSGMTIPRQLQHRHADLVPSTDPAVADVDPAAAETAIIGRVA